MIDEELNKKVLESLKRMNRIEKPFYDEGYICGKGQDDAIVMDTGNPVEIYSFLTSHVYKQDRYCRDAAMILYDHLRGITSRNIVCGPPGCGKTYVWECLQQVFPQILIVDAATLSKDGWSGGDKVSGFIDLVDPTKRDYIVVFDEFDKCATPQYSSYHENVSASLQSEFLKLVEGKRIKRKIGSEEIAQKINEIKNETSDFFFYEENDKIDVKESQSIISSLKLYFSCKFLFHYSTYGGSHDFSDLVFLKNNYFIILVDNHLLVFNLLNDILIKRYTFLGGCYYPKIIKWNSANDNEFLLINNDNITLIELNENNAIINLKIIGYYYLSDASSLLSYEGNEGNRFYLDKKDYILLY